MKLKYFIDLMKMVAMLLLVLGMAAYALILLLFAFSQPDAVKLVGNWPSKAFDIPMAGIAAFGIVSFLEGTKMETKTKGEFGFTALGLDFTGPAAPATLWVVVFLSIVVALTLSSN